MIAARRLAIALAALAALTAVAGCKRREAGARGVSTAAGSAAPAPSTFTQSYASPNGLITVRYPSEFAASPIGKQSVLLAHNLPSGRDEAISFTTADRPISSDLTEFTRVVELGATRELKNSNHYVELSRKNMTCNGVAGIEIRGTWMGETGVHYQRRACAFLRNGHGFLFSYSIAEEDAPAREAAVRAIVEATEFRP